MKQAILAITLLTLTKVVYSLPFGTDEDDGPQEDQPKPVPWKPVKSLSFLDLELALHGDPSEGEKEEKYMNHEIESSDNYVVVFKEEATAQDVESHKEMVKQINSPGKIKHEYEIGNDFRGYSASMTEHEAKEIENHPSVKYVEKSKVGHGEVCRYYQRAAPWGLVRSSSRSFDANIDTYYFFSNAAGGVNVYIIDSGIDIRHPYFYGRALWGFDAVDGTNSRRTDDHGHGTHVAGTVMSVPYGVAKRATAIAVRTCYNTNEGGTACPGIDTIAGINWVANQHKRGDKSIINMSLGFAGGYRPLDDAVRAAINNGIHVVAAAGNRNIDACSVSPARVAEAMTVSAINKNNEATYNYGNCVDISAPGVGIKSTLPNRSIGVWSGTSMAAPHVAGAMALILEYENLTPAEMKRRLQDISTKNQIENLREGTPNSILYIAC